MAEDLGGVEWMRVRPVSSKYIPHGVAWMGFKNKDALQVFARKYAGYKIVNDAGVG